MKADFSSLLRIKAQLKGRLTIDQKYVGKWLHIAFPLAGRWCLVQHDELIKIIGEITEWLLLSDH